MSVSDERQVRPVVTGDVTLQLSWCSEKVPGDPQQPQQVTVGCSPAPMSEPEEPRYLWQVGESLLQDGNYNPEDERVVRNGTKLVLTNWEWLKYLSTENLQGHSQSKTAGDLSQVIEPVLQTRQDVHRSLFSGGNGS